MRNINLDINEFKTLSKDVPVLVTMPDKVADTLGEMAEAVVRLEGVPVGRKRKLNDSIKELKRVTRRGR